MATTQLTDVYTPVAFDRAVLLETNTKNAIWQSPLVDRNSYAELVGSEAAKTFELPFDNDLGNEEPNIGNDNPNDKSQPNKVTSGKLTVAKNFHNNSWSEMDLAAQLHYGQEPLQRVAQRVGEYINRDYQRYLVHSLTGVIDENTTNDGGDMVIDISNDTSPKDAGIKDVIDAMGTMGDNLSEFSVIIMHSALYTQAKKNDLIQQVPDSQEGMPIETFAGLQVIVDDGVHVDSSGTNVSYDTYLAGPGLFQFAYFAPNVPSEVEREAASGNGAGQATLFQRWHFVLTPVGHSFDNSGIAGESPSYAELASEAQWTREWERQDIPFAALRSNG